MVVAAGVGTAIGLGITHFDSKSVAAGQQSPKALSTKSTPPLSRPRVSPESTTTEAASGRLQGKIVVIDPGHNGGNFNDPTFINSLIWNGREMETCDTTGAETDSGYTEALFNFDVAEYLSADLSEEGATVVLTRTNNDGVGPCVTQRAAIGNSNNANAAVSIHADGGPPTGSGFAVLEPVADGPNNSVITSSQILGSDIRSAFLSQAVEPVSDYDGNDGIQPRNDLAGLNLTTVPKVLVECANMRNAADAALIVMPSWQQSVARVLAQGITQFLTTS